MTSHYLKQWWPHLLRHICVTRTQWVNCRYRDQWKISAANSAFLCHSVDPIPLFTISKKSLSNFWHIWRVYMLRDHLCISELVITGLGKSLSHVWYQAYTLHQCWLIFDWTVWQQFQSNLNQDVNRVFQECAFEYIVCKLAAIFQTSVCYPIVC